jgi:hypothetical protein
MLNGVIDSSQVRGARSSRTSSSTSRRASERDLEFDRLQEALRQQQLYAESQRQYQATQNEYYATMLKQQQEFLRVSVKCYFFIFS